MQTISLKILKIHEIIKTHVSKELHSSGSGEPFSGVGSGIQPNGFLYYAHLFNLWAIVTTGVLENKNFVF